MTVIIVFINVFVILLVVVLCVEHAYIPVHKQLFRQHTITSLYLPPVIITNRSSNSGSGCSSGREQCPAVLPLVVSGAQGLYQRTQL